MAQAEAGINEADKEWHEHKEHGGCEQLSEALFPGNFSA